MKNRRPTIGLHKYLSVLPSVVLALLPRLACPCQFPAYAGLLGSLGLTFLMQTMYLFPLTAACLTFAVGGLAVRAKSRQGYAPFWVGLLAAMLLMIGKFIIASDRTVYVAIAVLLMASFWNSWPSNKRSKLRFTADGQVELGPDPKS
jgi:mercuric ion transport protein